MGISRNDMIMLLNHSHINYMLMEHKAIYTVLDGIELDLPHSDVIAKSLFLCDDKKQNYYLISLPKEKQIDIKTLRTKIGSRRLTLVSENEVHEILGLPKGAVTPLGVLNDDLCKVKVIIDKAYQSSLIAIPLNENTVTIWLKASALAQIIRQHGNEVCWIEL